VSLDALLEPWSSGLMRRALLESVLAGLLCGALGCFVLVRGLAFLGEGTAHTIVLGVALAVLVGAPAGLGAVLVAGLTVVLAQVIGSDARFGADAAMGVVMPSLFGAGVALAAVAPGYRTQLEDVLFGSVLAVTEADLALAAGVALVAALVLLLAGKELVLASFDRPMAAAMGYPVRALDLLLLGLLALAAVVALRAVGNVLLAALLLGPPATARLVCRRFWSMAALAAGLGAAAGVAGLALTWHLDVGAGPAIVLVVTALYLVTALAARLRGAVATA
jgi:ABC-type Mn2+/Zn2+ transport system permease subunit